MSFANMESKGLDVSSFRKNTLWLCTNGEEGDGYTNYYFRNDRETMIKALMEINSTIRKEKLKFQILDNNGDISEFKIYEYVSLIGDTKNLDKKLEFLLEFLECPIPIFISHSQDHVIVIGIGSLTVRVCLKIYF